MRPQELTTPQRVLLAAGEILVLVTVGLSVIGPGRALYHRHFGEPTIGDEIVFPLVTALIAGPLNSFVLGPLFRLFLKRRENGFRQ